MSLFHDVKFVPFVVAGQTLSPGNQNRYLDLSFDWQYQYIGQHNTFTLLGHYTWFNFRLLLQYDLYNVVNNNQNPFFLLGATNPKASNNNQAIMPNACGSTSSIDLAGN